jgi:hypothetical protein
MKNKVIILALILVSIHAYASNEDKYMSPTEGVINTNYMGEQGIKTKCIEMISRFMTYADHIYTDYKPNSEGTPTGYFKARHQGQSDEDGVRTNADMAMVSAFMHKYGVRDHIRLPDGISYEKIADNAHKALIYSYSTHRSTRLLTCTDGLCWGSDTLHTTWESSLWTESLAFAAWMLDDVLTEVDRCYIKKVITAEADCNLRRDIPTGYNGDTKAEENGWDTNVLSLACALYPDAPHAQLWYDKMKQFAMNSYSMAKDSIDTTMIGDKKVKDWYIGQNLFDDYTLQNHHYFHTSYQNVVIQELSESYLALKCLNTRFVPAPQLLWHQQDVMNNVLKWLALADGELAMPNGNDWSMFLYDQLTAYTSIATIMHDTDALMLENMALKYIEARQKTTLDGSWMLNSDIGPRRMGVTAHRVMMNYLLHEYFSIDNLRPSTWDDFAARHAGTKIFPCQKIIRSMSKSRFACFSFSEGLKDVTGIIVPNVCDHNKIIVPYKANGSGNFIGTYDNGKNTEGKMMEMKAANGGWKVSGTMKAASGRLPYLFKVHATADNAMILIDALKPDKKTIINNERGGTLAVSVDDFTSKTRTIYYHGGHFTSDGNTLKTFESNWANIDNNIGIIAITGNTRHNQMAFGDRELLNSIYTAKIYPTYSSSKQTVTEGLNHIRCFIYYVNVNAEQTEQLAAKIKYEISKSGKYKLTIPEPDGTRNVIVDTINLEKK